MEIIAANAAVRMVTSAARFVSAMIASAIHARQDTVLKDAPTRVRQNAVGKCDLTEGKPSGIPKWD